MSVNEAFSPELFPAETAQALATTVPTPIVPTDRDALYRRIPDALTKFAPSESWHCIAIDEILNHTVQPTLSNLYIDGILLKTHAPNLVFEQIRKVMVGQGYFAFRIVTAENIKAMLQQQLSEWGFYGYYAIHFLFRRALPKLKGFRKLCRLLNTPVDMSKAEIMGRLVYKGFDLIDSIETPHETILVAKVNHLNNPSESKPLPNEGFLFRMQRVGQHGQPITVYKFRSMHPYAEYVQEYLYRTNGIDEGGKFRNDFRVSTGGRLIRKYWVDELPMLINLLKGDIKLVGVRPISEHYFSLYPDAAQQLRRRHKPGLLPPYYADLPTEFDEIVQSEMNYLTCCERNPVATDFAYLLKILRNIVIHKVRSK